MTAAPVSPETASKVHDQNASFEHRRPLRVCYLIDELAPAGTETQLLALIRSLDRSRVEPFLCLLRGANPVSRALEPDNCTVVRYEVGSLRSLSTLAKAWCFAKFLRNHQIDVLQVYFPDSSYFGIPVAWIAGVPLRVRTRNNLGHWLTPMHRRLGRLLNYLTTATVANCEAARNALLRDETPGPDSVFVLENGADLERFLSLRQPPVTPPRVGVVANLRPVKGLDVFLEACILAAAKHPQATFAVAGEGECRPALTQLAANHGLADRFLLPGIVTDIPGFLAGLHVAVLSSRSEGMSNALLEYMAAGRPIVATAVGAAPELIDHGVHGLLVPPGDPKPLADGIDCLLRDPDLARRLGEAARRRVRERHSRAAMVRRFEDFYDRLAGEKSPPSLVSTARDPRASHVLSGPS